MNRNKAKNCKQIVDKKTPLKNINIELTNVNRQLSKVNKQLTIEASS